MDERKPLIRSKCKDQEDEKNHNGEWDAYQFVWILLALMCSSTGSLMSLTLNSQYVYSRVAKEHSVNASDVNTAKSPCLSSNSSAENIKKLDEVQEEATQWILIFGLCLSIPSIFVNVFFGIRADSWGRKPLLIIPTVGSLIRALVGVATVQWDLPLYVIAIGSVMEGFCGSIFAFLIAVFSCAADLTSASKDRSFSIAVFQGVSGTVSGLVLIGSGYFIRNTGFFYLALTIAFSYALAVLIECCLVKETLKKSNILTLKQRLYSIVSLYSNGEHRLIYIICMVTFFLKCLSDLASSSVTTLYAMNEPFCFTSVEVGWLTCAGMLVPGFGGILLLKLFQQCSRDEVIVILSLLSSGGSMVLQTLATYKYQIYLVPLVGVMGNLIYSLLRGMLSRITDHKQQGALFGSFGAVEPLSYIVSSLVLNLIYEKTVDVYPATVFVFMGGVSAVMLLLFLCVVCRKTPQVKIYDNVNEEVIINS